MLNRLQQEINQTRQKLAQKHTDKTREAAHLKEIETNVLELRTKIQGYKRELPHIESDLRTLEMEKIKSKRETQNDDWDELRLERELNRLERELKQSEREE